MTKKDKQEILINAVSLIAAPFTGGLSLLGLGIPYIFDGNDGADNTATALEELKIKQEQWKIDFEAREKEKERLWQERQDNLNAFKNNSDEVIRLNAIINDPNRTDEEKNNARKRIVILEDENKTLKEKLDKINEKLEELNKTSPPPPSRPWSSYLPKLKTMDKIILVGGISLVAYLLISKEK